MAAQHGQAVGLTSWISLVAMCLAVLIKVVSKFSKIHKLQLDDYLLMCAMVFAIAQTIVASEMIHFGLEDPRDEFNATFMEGLQKSLYASQILFMPAVAIPKIATTMFIGRLSIEPRVHYYAATISSVCTAWLVCGLFVTVFQCAPPQTWEIVPGKCIDWTAFWASMAAIDILLDLAQIALIVSLCWRLNTKRTTILFILAAFVARTCIAPVNVLRVIYIHRAYASPTSSEISLHFPRAAIVTEIIVNVGIVLHCLPFMRPVTNSLEHGFFSTDLRNTLHVKSINQSEIKPAAAAAGKTTPPVVRHVSGLIAGTNIQPQEHNRDRISLMELPHGRRT